MAFTLLALVPVCERLPSSFILQPGRFFPNRSQAGGFDSKRD